MKQLTAFFFVFLICIGHAYANSVHTRPANEGEEEILYVLIRELADHEGNSLASASFLSKENLKRYGFGIRPFFFTEFAEVDGRVVGYALYYYAFSGNRGKPILYLEDLYVKPEYRKKGAGTALMKQLARYAKEHECCCMEWNVFAWNRSAIEFYQKIGGIFRNDLTQVRLEGNALEQFSYER